MRKVLAVLALAALPAAGNAADVGLFADAGTFGFGGGVAVHFNDHIGARVGYETLIYKVRDLEESDLTIDGEVKVGGIKALLDWYPMGGGFHISAGAISNSTKIDALAKPQDGWYTIGDNVYDATDLSNARASARFPSVVPYVGIGFGRALSRDGRLGITLDAGVAFTGSPTVELTATCMNDAVCASLSSDIEQERAELQEEADQLKVWPMLNVAVSYKF